MFETIGILIAFCAALVVVLAMALGAHWGHKRSQGLLPYIVYPMLLVYALSTLFSGRNLTETTELGAVVLVAKHPAVAWLGRLTSVFILFACGERILHRMLQANKGPLANGLVLAFWIFFLTNTASPALLGRHFYLTHEFLYVLLAGWAALLITNEDEFNLALRCARNAGLLFLLGSLACLVFKPQLVMATNYQGLVPGLRWRFSGLASHANTMGSLAVFIMVCIWRQPFASTALRIGSWLLTALVVVLAQSKTSWISLLLCGAAFAYFGRREEIQRRLRDFRNPHLPVLLVLIVVFGTLTGCLGLMLGGSEKLARFFGTQAGADLMSLSGRNQIWEVAVQEWYKNPIFGYGLNIWDEAFRNGVGLPFAIHAHSQFYQSLSSAGLVGAAGLLIYAAVLLYMACKTAASSGGLSLALFILLACKAISEVPLATTGLSPDVFNLVLLLAALSTFHVKGRLAQRPLSAPAPAPTSQAVGLQGGY